MEPRIYLLYYENLRIWAREFGKENILVRVYDDQIQDVIENFCQLVGLNYAQLKKIESDAETVNTKLTPLASEVMQKALALNINSQSMALMKRVLKETSYVLINQNPQLGARIFTEEFLDNICAVYQDDTKKLKKMFPATECITDNIAANVPDTLHAKIQCPEQDMQQLIANLLANVDDKRRQ